MIVNQRRKIRQAIRSHAVALVDGCTAGMCSHSSWSPELQDPCSWVFLTVGTSEILVCRAYFTSELAAVRYAVYYLTRIWAGRDPHGS